MPQMAPLYWLYLFFFFLTTLLLFIIINYFIKPFPHMKSPSHSSKTPYKLWKL
nr:ATPase F0 subunit 8 [Ilyoplax integra]